MKIRASSLHSVVPFWGEIYKNFIGFPRRLNHKATRIKQYLNREIDKYVDKHTSSLSPLVEELERETRAKTEYPGMLCGKIEGQLLQLLIKIARARNVLEIGTFTGYSALIMAEGLPEDGTLITCEISEVYANIATHYFARSPHGRKIKLKIGPALDTLRQLPSTSVDIVFIDADKTSYPLYYDESIRILRSGGIIVADNVLCGGQAISPRSDRSRGVASFNRKVMKDSRVEKVMLTLRDGIYLIRKK